MSNHGSFSGNPKTEWLVNANEPDRDMMLLDDFWYIDPDERKWMAPRGSIIDGASIPQPLWNMIGSPYTDDYRRASIVHDIACKDPNVNRKDADEMFREACLAGGCSLSQAKILYLGVRFGAWSGGLFPLDLFNKKRPQYLSFVPPETKKWMSTDDRPTPSADENFLVNKFREMAEELNQLPDDASIAEIDKVIADHIKL